MSQIKISILIPAFNYPKGIKNIIECLKFSNTIFRKNIEVIISDDSDRKIIDSEIEYHLKKTFGNFQYIYNKEPLGGVLNWNKLISKAQGEYFWLLHHDEYWEKEKDLINKIFDVIKKENPSFLIFPITKEREIIFNNLIINIIQKHFSTRNILNKFLTNPKLLIELNILGPPSAIIYKKSLIKYNTNLKFLVDVDFYIKLLSRFNSKKVLIMQDYYLLSSQNNNKSITKSLSKSINQIKYKEKKFLRNRYKFNLKFSEKVFLLYSYINLKFNSLISIRMKIKRNI